MIARENLEYLETRAVLWRLIIDVLNTRRGFPGVHSAATLNCISFAALIGAHVLRHEPPTSDKAP
jgi:hypothetical protein